MPNNANAEQRNQALQFALNRSSFLGSASIESAGIAGLLSDADQIAAFLAEGTVPTQE